MIPEDHDGCVKITKSDCLAVDLDLWMLMAEAKAVQYETLVLS